MRREKTFVFSSSTNSRFRHDIMDTPKILIVEDDGDLAEMLDSYFRIHNYEVLTAAWGQDALTISQQEDISLIMLDIHLPDMDGYEVCRQIRQNRMTQDVPIIFLTGRTERLDKLQGLELGVVDYVTKPFDTEELLLRVRNAILRTSQRINPVTGLPEPPLLDERLEIALNSDQPWSILLLSIIGLDTLRERQGFVAADEMLRAVTLMVRSAIRKHGSESDLIAHFDPETFAILTLPDNVDNVRERIETRLRLSLPNFYHPDDDTSETDYLDFKFGLLDHTAGSFPTLDSLKGALAITIALDTDTAHDI